MKMKISNEIRIIVDQETADRLQQEMHVDEFHTRTMSEVVREALHLYFMYKDEENEVQSSGEETSPDPEEVVHKGLIVPDYTNTKVRPPRPTGIEGGPGVTNRLIAAGINPIDIVKAKRNRKAGRDWDKSLEPYFDLL